VEWFDRTYPQLSYPARRATPPDPVEGPDPTFSWLPIPTGEAVDLSIEVMLHGQVPVWDSSGVSVQDTSIVIPYEFRDASFFPEYWYTWTVTLYNENGNAATSLPGYFAYFDPPSAGR
jgi:hypothetical protein